MATVVYWQRLTEPGNLYLSWNIPYHYQLTPNRDPSISDHTMLWMIENWKAVDLFVWSKKWCWKISLRNRLKICYKNKISWWFQINRDKDNIIFIHQLKIAANEPKQVYFAIKQIRTILITHSSDIDCRSLKRTKRPLPVVVIAIT